MAPNRSFPCAAALILRLTVLLGIACAAYGQFETASVLGSVSDARGGIISQARVSLQSVDTGTAQVTMTDANGGYQFLQVKVGQYRVVAEFAGFNKTETPIFRVAVGARQRLDLTMQVGDTAQSIQVEATASQLEQESSDRGQVVQREQVANLPLNGRSSAALALLAPGVRLAYGLAKREASFNVSGLRSQFNNFILDGVDNNAYGTSNQGLSNQVVQVSPDALQEFKVISNAYSAEYGRVGGAVVNASVRGGTNEYHGSAWDYLRNTSLNAVGFFKPTGGQKPVYIQNQFGATFGGPIKKDKIFFFADYEGLRRLQRALSFGSVPTADQRVGNLGIPVKNPYTGAMYDNGIIPASVITKFGLRVLGDLPLPNLPGNTKNYSALLPATDNDDKGDIRYDQYLTRKVTFFSRYSHRLYNQLAAPNNQLPGPSGQGGGIVSRVKNWQTASGVTWNISPTSLAEFRVGVSKSEGMKTPATLDGGPDMLAAYGIPGLPTDKALTGGLNTQNITGYASYGRDYTSPQWQDPFVVNPKVNYSKIFGRQTLKIGYEYQAINTLVDDFNPAYGQDIYGGQFSNPTPTRSNALYNISDFLFGARSTYQLTNFTVANLRQRMQFFYLQDDFKLSSRLTLNLGVRYEFATPQYERDNKMANLDPVTNKLIPAKGGSTYDRALVHPQYRNFGPRLGLAYSVTPKTVVRAGYGISFVLFMRQGGDSYLAYNGPYVVNSQITQSPSQGICGPNAPPLTCFRPTEQGIPAGFTSPENFSTLLTKTVYIDPTIRTPYVQNWHFTIQRELARNLLLDVGYAGNHSLGLWVNADLNQAVPNLAGQSLGVKPRRPNTQFDYIDANYGAGFSSYHALQVKLEKRYSQGLTFLNSFAWSKAIDNASGALEAGNNDHQAVNILSFASSKGRSGYDQPFNNTTSVVWNLPFGKGRHFGSSLPFAADALLGGWNLSGINTMVSGQPINLIYSPSASFIATDGSKNSAIYRPNVTGNPMLPKDQRTIARYFNTDNVQIPNDVTHPYGNAGRNIARSDSFFNLDLGIHKQFRLFGERANLQFRAEMFNALNKTNFSPANSDRANAAFGTISGTFPARQLQFALRFAF